MSAKCDYCGQPGIQLTGETNGVLVCVDHAGKADTPRYTSADLTLEMSRRVEQAERRAEEAEFHVEQLRDARDSAERRVEHIEARAVELATERDAALARIARAERLIDSWEHDAADHSNPVFIGRLRECLRRDPAPVRLRGEERCVVCSRLAPLHGGLCCFHKYDEQPLCIHCASDEDPACEHEWLDRPESDTRECLICGTEVAG